MRGQKINQPTPPPPPPPPQPTTKMNLQPLLILT